ncbi:MAG TPA: carboxypeptidase regulatory-like domain-containing protein [Candidatus Baltobacteraceae bacterium]|nr:carboxypeptidase regulatory-like domain-containing protein [Candidatus Baltobacteraceae bacterium]
MKKTAAFVLALILALCFARHAGLAQTGTGVIRGTVTEAKTKAPLADVRVVASSGSGTYRVQTNARGEYTMLGVLPDTYVLSFTRENYGPVSTAGITVLVGTVQVFDAAMTLNLRTIVSIRSKTHTSAGSAFQPNMTTDNYTVTGNQITMVQGKQFNPDENQLLRSIPSVTIDKSGTVSIRGGFAFEAGYEFEGIDYTTPTPNLQNTLQNIGNFNLLNGVGSVQLIPGGGDATHGNTGTGLVILTAKHGTYPASYHLDLEAGYQPEHHQLGAEWSWANKSGRLSNYFGYLGVNEQFQYGYRGMAANVLGSRGTNAASLGSLIDPNLVYYSPMNLHSNDFVDNLIYRFGRNNHEYLQLFGQSQAVNQTLDYGGSENLFYSSGGGLQGQCSQSIVGIIDAPNTPAQDLACQSLIPLYPAQKTTSSYVGQPDHLNNSWKTFKVQYGNNLNSNTLLTLKFYRAFAKQDQQLPAFGIFASPYGGTRTNGSLDVTSAIGSKHLIKAGLTYTFSQPQGERFDVTSYTAFTADPAFIVYPLLHNGQAPPIGTTPPNFNPAGFIPGAPEIDFLTPQQCAVYQQQFAISQKCGYLYSYLPGAQRFPAERDLPTASQQVYGAYLQDDVTFNSRWRSEIGIRLDGYNFIVPQDPSNPPGINGLQHQRLYEPHLNITYAPDAQDVIRAGYGRTLSIPLPSQLGANVERNSYAAFANVPSFNNATGLPATYCGVRANQLCTSYADQLYWLTRDYHFGGQALSAALYGATFTNYDLSWAHQFRDGAAIKVTPFYRQGYNVIEQTAQIVGFNTQTGLPIYGDQSYSNLGQQKATGVEFLYTKERAIGLSAQIGATYINQFGNEPPGTYLTPAALAAGELYRSPDLSPFQLNIAFQQQTRTGWRINPVIALNAGYPYGAGYYTAIYCNGHAVLVPTTDLNSIFSTAPNYVDPQNPGTCTNPNIAAGRGNKEPALPGGLLSSPQAQIDVTVEYQHPGTPSLFGMQIKNLLNRVWNVPIQNTCYGVPVVTGVSSGTSPCTFSQPQYGNSGWTGYPYAVYPNQQPLTFYFYYQVRR